MDIEKLQQLMSLSNQYKAQYFWKDVFASDNICMDHMHPSDTAKQTEAFFSKQDVFPRCDVYATNESLVIDAELPGVERSEIKVFLYQEELVITGECKTLKSGLQYYIKERPNRKFEKKLTIPVSINRSAIETHFTNGILTIILPIMKEDAEKIPIKVDEDESSSSE
ncbi:Hsp20/alpha crystallin family protein [Bacillus sp. FJAT-29790]|uniref:Hsp20/alpha crystallin family protein n=1 Tax=Bacillus sp. FJAT-29790 TaxID=1895002 RepID=UPI001C24C50A|nr:Hsp20/alpha crystallin family protein [Bacillus sp. FJAT-29790]MBU8878901.1 Hsp20/alpha crystallin family protein [Bacillus sp. FJAT-29790]